MAGEYLVSKKYHEISILAEETAKQVSKNGEEWMKYLTTAARLYNVAVKDRGRFVKCFSRSFICLSGKKSVRRDESIGFNLQISYNKK